MAIMYDKLVRDRVVEGIKKKGDIPYWRIATREEYPAYLDKKLREEVEEYTEAKNRKEVIEELADILEVIFAACGQRGITIEEVLKTRERKLEEKGGFRRRMILEKVVLK